MPRPALYAAYDQDATRDALVDHALSQHAQQVQLVHDVCQDEEQEDRDARIDDAWRCRRATVAA